MADGADHGAGGAFDGARLLRFAEALDASVDEVRSMPPGSLRVADLEAIVARTVGEAEHVVPTALLPELHALIAPLHDPETEPDLRVVLVELNGWIRGLLGTMGIALAIGNPEEGPGSG